MFKARGWVSPWDLKEEQEQGLEPEPAVTTVIFQEIDRGIELPNFSDYIAKKYPNIRDLWITQNWITGQVHLREFYNRFKFRSFVVEVSQSGIHYEQFEDAQPPQDGLLALYDPDREREPTGYGFMSDGPGFIRLGKDFDPNSDWYIFCYMYAYTMDMPMTKEHNGNSCGDYRCELPEPTSTSTKGLELRARAMLTN